MGISKLLLVLVGGLVSIAMLLIHPAGPGVVLLAISPFDALWSAFFGVAGNGITYVPIGAMLLRTSPSLWTHILTGSRIQLAIVVFLVGILMAHVIVVPEQGLTAGLAYARKITLFLIVGLLVWSWRKPEYLTLSIKVFVVSTAAYCIINMLDFYLNISILPQVSGREIESIQGREYAANISNEFRMQAVGLPINRWAGWMLLPVMLSIGWLTHARSLIQRLLAGGCLLVLVVGELSTISRSGLGSMLVGLAIVGALAFRLKPTNLVLLALGSAVLVGGALAAVEALRVDEVLESRLDPRHFGHSASGRLERTRLGLIIFGRSPIYGVGINNFEVHSRPMIDGAPDAHNGYIHVLAELGLMGFLPFMAILGLAAVRLLSPAPRVPATYEHFRPYFLAGLAANCVHMTVHSYEWERVLWISIAFAATYERIAREVRVGAAREAAAVGAGAPGGSLPPPSSGGWPGEALPTAPRTSDA